jgi:hypothetical protein
MGLLFHPEKISRSDCIYPSTKGSCLIAAMSISRWKFRMKGQHCMLFTFSSVCLSATLDAQVLQLEQHVKSGRREFDERLMDEKGGGDKSVFPAMSAILLRILSDFFLSECFSSCEGRLKSNSSAARETTTKLAREVGRYEQELGDLNMVSAQARVSVVPHAVHTDVA